MTKIESKNKARNWWILPYLREPLHPKTHHVLTLRPVKPSSQAQPPKNGRHAKPLEGWTQECGNRIPEKFCLGKSLIEGTPLIMWTKIAAKRADSVNQVRLAPDLDNSRRFILSLALPWQTHDLFSGQLVKNAVADFCISLKEKWCILVDCLGCQWRMNLHRVGFSSLWCSRFQLRLRPSAYHTLSMDMNERLAHPLPHWTLLHPMMLM